jgi:hypothetical protein
MVINFFFGEVLSSDFARLLKYIQSIDVQKNNFTTRANLCVRLGEIIFLKVYIIGNDSAFKYLVLGLLGINGLVVRRLSFQYLFQASYFITIIAMKNLFEVKVSEKI